MRNHYLEELRNAENNYYSKKVIENRDDPKKMWTVLKEILGKKIQNPIKSVQIDNNIYSDKQTIANELNAYFVKSIEQINHNIPNPVQFLSFNNNITVSSFKFKKINVNVIVKAINQINSKSDQEWLRPDIMLDSIPIVGHQFCEIINESFAKGIFPNWKCSTVVPVEKITGTIKADELR